MNMEYLKSGLLYLWQLPQNLLGLFVLLILGIFNNKNFMDFGVWDGTMQALKFKIPVSGNFFVFNNSKKKMYGYSLGCYIFASYDRDYMVYHYGNEDIEERVNIVIAHEVGHSIQSVYLGWLYLPVIGLPSLIVTGISPRLAKKFYTEKWAEKLALEVSEEEEIKD
jgi:hypothetical protein